MRNIDEKTIAALLERIESLKNELSLLEEQVKALPVDAGQPEVAGQPLEDDQVHPGPAEVEADVILGEAKDLSESQDLPADEPEEAIDIAPVDDTPIDISIPGVEDLPEEAGLKSSVAPAEPGKAILDTAKADTAVMDVMAEKQAWRTDRPGMPVKNIISAISLNDRVFLINTLFGEDPVLFQETISKFNAMGSLSEALDYIAENHSDWDMSSDSVYRLMMAVRRKLS
ncbi:MAG: hypothetical protein IKW89_00700 [Bacteroidales bacterium]|nr:hypothetical protein [Bacteroidales bacterium]